MEELTKEVDQLKSDIKRLSSHKGAGSGSGSTANGDDLQRQIVSIQRQLTEFGKMGAGININDDETLDPKEKVQKWLEERVRLPQYFELFIKEGFDELDVIKAITKQDLTAMGIDKLGHQRRIIQNAEQL